MARNTPAVTDPTEEPAAPAEIVKPSGVPAVRQQFSDFLTENHLWADTSGIIERIMSAKDLDAALDAFKTTKADAILGVPLEVHGISFLESNFDESTLQVYGLIRAVNLDTGEKLTVSCGGDSIVTTLARAQVEGWLPARFRIIRAEKTGAGFFPLNLERVVEESDF